MRNTLVIAGCALALAGAAHAADGKPTGSQPAAKQVAQTTRMKSCNADAKAKALKGDARKAFMGECLKKKA
jgi:hypothetical protein